MKKILGAALAIGLLTALNCAALAQQPPARAVNEGEKQGPAARLVIEAPVFNGGEIEPGQPFTHEFTIANEGDAPLTISEVRPGCGCSVADFDPLVPPGAVSRITVSVQVYPEWAGQNLRKTAWVLTNDPLNPQARLIMEARVRPAPEASAESGEALSGDR